MDVYKQGRWNIIGLVWCLVIYIKEKSLMSDNEALLSAI